MSEVQLILAALGAALHDRQIGEEDCDGLCRALNGVPAEYHMDAFKALLGMEVSTNA